MLDLVFRVITEVAKVALPAIAVGAAVGATIYLIANWPEIKDKISSWLHQHNFDKSFLMDALVFFDKIFTGIRRRIVVETRQTGQQIIEEETLSMEEVKRRDPDLYKELQKRSSIEIDIMEQIQ